MVSHREIGGTLGMVPLLINPIYTLYSGYLLGTPRMYHPKGPPAPFSLLVRLACSSQVSQIRIRRSHPQDQLQHSMICLWKMANKSTQRLSMEKYARQNGFIYPDFSRWKFQTYLSCHHPVIMLISAVSNDGPTQPVLLVDPVCYHLRHFHCKASVMFSTSLAKARHISLLPMFPDQENIYRKAWSHRENGGKTLGMGAP